MRFSYVLLAIFFTMSTSKGQTTVGQHITQRPGEVLVKFRAGISVNAKSPQATATSNSLAAALGQEVNLVGVYGKGSILHLKTSNAGAAVNENAGVGDERRPDIVKTMTKMAAESPQIEYVQPNYVYYSTAIPNDKLLSELRFVKKIELDQAWDIQHDAEEIIVAVIDTGVLTSHPDLAANIWRNPGEIPNNGKDDDKNGFVDDINGWDFFNDDNNPTADLVNVGFSLFGFCLEIGGQHFEAHGSHVAGTIGAEGNNEQGIAGVAWKTRIMPLKFLGGPCGNGDTADAIKAIDYAVNNGAKIINCSWGGRANDADGDPLLKEALENAAEQDVLVVCAAGNEAADNDATPHFPSNFNLKNLISVGASDDADKRASFSNAGKTTVHLFAPGVDIHSTVPDGDAEPAVPGFRDLSGTSMAAPVVSGVAALVRTRFPSLAAPEVRKWLMATTDEVPDLSDLCITGGRINARFALQTPLLPKSLRTPVMLTANDRRAVEAQLKSHDLIRMVIHGGMPLRMKTDVAEVNGKIPVEFLIKFNEKMTRDAVRATCGKSQINVEAVEVVSQERNVFQVTGVAGLPLEKLFEILKKQPKVVIVQLNRNYHPKNP